MRYPDQFFYDLYGKNIKYTMTIFMFIVAMILAYIFYEASKYEDFLKSELHEIKIFKIYNHRGVAYMNNEYSIQGTCTDSICMYVKLTHGAILRKSEHPDTIIIIDQKGEIFKFNVNEDDGW